MEVKCVSKYDPTVLLSHPWKQFCGYVFIISLLLLYPSICDIIHLYLGRKAQHQMTPSSSLPLLWLLIFLYLNWDCLYVEIFDRSFTLTLEI